MLQFSCQIIPQKSETVAEVGPKKAMLRISAMDMDTAKSQGRFTNFKPNKGTKQ